MSILLAVQGPDTGRRFPLDRDCIVLGRQIDSPICLSGMAVSRQHAQILRRFDGFYIEDMGSSNGTYVNGRRLPPRKPTLLADTDALQIGPHILMLRSPGNPAGTISEPNLVVRESLSTRDLFQAVGTDSAGKLQVALEIAQNLARTLDLDPLLGKLLEQLMRLFPNADRAMVILCEQDELIVRGILHRQGRGEETFSRTIVRRALEEGVGILSDNVKADERFQASQTLSSLRLHSVVVAPLINPEGRRLGVLKLDRYRLEGGFRHEDLQLLTLISMQVSVALENTSLHAERLREQRLHQELALAREIQEGFLPEKLDSEARGFEIWGRVYPASQVSGDFYDYFFLPGGQLAFFIGDVSGKGMPAALFMVAVRTLGRHLSKEGLRPGQLMAKLNEDLADDNPAAMFVTLAHGIYDPETGNALIASAGHPPPILRRTDGSVEEMTLASGRLLGIKGGGEHWPDLSLNLDPGELVVFFTDGFTEARSQLNRAMFGSQSLAELIREWRPELSLLDAAEQARAAVEGYTGGNLRDDATLLALRRKIP